MRFSPRANYFRSSKLISLVCLLFLLVAISTLIDFAGFNHPAQFTQNTKINLPSEVAFGHDGSDWLIFPDPPANCGFNTIQDPPLNEQLCGYAWGSTPEGGVGWLSFNSRDCDVDVDGTINNGEENIAGCPVAGTTIPRYGVQLKEHHAIYYTSPSPSHVGTSFAYTGKRYLVGCAWSPNIGWVKFGGFKSTLTQHYDQQDAQGNWLSHPNINSKIGRDRPSDTGVGCNFLPWSQNGGNCGNARVATSTSNVDFFPGGWARACAATPSGNCLDSNENAVGTNTGGWDGWISLGRHPQTTLSNSWCFDGLTTTPCYNSFNDQAAPGSVNYSGVSGIGGELKGYSWGGDVVGWLKWGPGFSTDGSGANWANIVRLCGVVPFEFDVSTAPTSVSFNFNNTGQSNTGTVVATVTKTSLGQSTQAVNLEMTMGTGTFPPSSITTTLQTGSCATFPCPKSVNLNVPSDVPTGEYKIGVKGTDTNGIFDIASTTINVIAAAPPTSGNLNVLCEAPPVSAGPFYVNKPISWKVTVSRSAVTDPVTPMTPPFTFTAVYDSSQESGVTSQPSNANPFYVSKTYTTIGKKMFRIENLEDSSSPLPSTSTSCPPGAEITVTVAPDIIER